jgi:tRNA modification GTPase
LKEERAIVSDIPGTTRDTIEESFQYEGISFRLIDTAGIRKSEDSIEQQGIERTLTKIEQAKLVVYLFDSSQFEVHEILSDVKDYLEGVHFILVATKKDIYQKDRKDKLRQLEKDSKSAIPLITVKNEEERNELLEKIYTLSIGTELEEHSTVVSNARHVQNLELAAQSLTKAKAAIKNEVSGDFIAMDIRQAMFQIGQITADISTEDLLGDIFSNFCIGK